MPTQTTIVLLLLGGFAAAGGCLADPTAVLVPFAPERVSSFTARGGPPGSEAATTISLSGPTLVPDHYRTGQLAYNLTFQVVRADGTPVTVSEYYDRAFRLIVVRRECNLGKAECGTTVEWNWSDRGSLSAWGLGYPKLAHRKELVSYEGRIQERWDWSARAEENGTLRFEATRSAGDDEQAPRVLWYAKGLAFPNSSAYRLEGVRLGPPMELADEVVFEVGVPEPRPWTGLMFHGEDVDTFGVGFGHAAIAKASEPRLGTTNAVCVRSYSMLLHAPSPRDPSPLPASPLESPRPQMLATVDLMIMDEDFLHIRQVRVWHSKANESRWLEFGPIDRRDPGMACADFRKSPWPTLDIPSSRGLADAMSLSVSRFQGVSFGVGAFRDPGVPPSQGWHAVRVVFEPAYVNETKPMTWTSFQVTFQPIRGNPLLGVIASPTDRFWT